jgi:WD and tetratricopeptide repeat-containing protein 1
MSLEPLFQYNIEGMDSPPSVTVLPPSNLPSIINHLNSEDEIPHEAKTLRDNGNKYYQEKQYTQAIQCYSSALTICPHWHILYSNRATCLMSRNWSGDVYEALRDTELALYVFPAHYKSLKRRIKLLKVLKWNKEALAFLDSFEEEYPDEEEFIKKMREDVSSEQSRNGYHGLNGARRDMSNWEADRQATAHDYHQRYLGHCNTHTDIKEATFLGERGEYIGAGSDDGNIFIWEKKTGNLVRVLYADENIVNCVQWHPKSCLLATSGIENVIRLWEPKCTDDTTRVVGNMVQACSKNQARRRFDPFELMLVGLRMIEDPSTHLRDNVVIQRGDYHIRSEQCHQS